MSKLALTLLCIMTLLTIVTSLQHETWKGGVYAKEVYNIYQFECFLMFLYNFVVLW